MKFPSLQESTLEEENLPKPDTLRVLKTNSPEWPYIVVGLISSIIMGASMPVYAILFGDVSGPQRKYCTYVDFAYYVQNFCCLLRR